MRVCVCSYQRRHVSISVSCSTPSVQITEFKSMISAPWSPKRIFFLGCRIAQTCTRGAKYSAL